MPREPFTGTELIGLLCVEPDAPFGYDFVRNLLTAEEFDRRYSTGQYDYSAQRTYSRYPPYFGAVEGSGRIFDDLTEFATANPEISLDRIGEDDGSYFGLVVAGIPTSLESRGMDPRTSRSAHSYIKFRFAPAFPPAAKGWVLWTSRACPAFGHAGGGGQAIFFKPRPLELIADTRVRDRVAELHLGHASFHAQLLQEFPLGTLYLMVSCAEALAAGVIYEVPATEWS